MPIDGDRCRSMAIDADRWRQGDEDRCSVV